MALRQLEAFMADARVDEGIADEDVALANLLDGLLVYRRHQLSGDISDTELWPGLLIALMAPQLDPQASYYAGHVAEMLGECSLHNAAYHFAMRAYEIFPDDEWLQSTLITSQANWRGILDEGV